MFFKRDRRDRERSEIAAASRIRDLSARETHLENADPEEVNRRLRNMSYGSTHSRVTAGRGEEHQILRTSAIVTG
jgi:hypothetical protein